MQAQAVLYSLYKLQLDEDAEEKQVCLIALLVLKYFMQTFAPAPRSPTAAAHPPLFFLLD
jgi:hypothetical protein